MTKKEWPRTVAEAVDTILHQLDADPEAVSVIKSTPKDDLIKFHHGWGTQIRNDFGLWQGNVILLKDCDKHHPDDASMVIIEAVWERLQN